MTHARTSTSPNHWDSGAQSVHRRINSSLWAGTEIALLTGGFDRPYAYGLAMALSSKGLGLDVIGSDEIDSPEMHTTPKVKFLNLHGSRREASLANRIWRELTFYLRLIRYAKTATPRIFHILWNNRLQVFDRTLLMLYYKLLGKKLVLTAHNVNAGRRDLNDSPLNRLTLKIQYRLVDHIFVHTDQMKAALSEEFAIREEKVTVIPFGINNSVPSTDLTPEEAKRRLGIKNMEKTILFFGALRPYKGLECLVAAFQRIAAAHEGYRLIVAAEPKKGDEQYLCDINKTIETDPSRAHIIQRMEFIPDEGTEVYFKAADVLVLPYKQIFQSGVLFLSYNFGLPVVATDVGSFRDDIVEGTTGFLARSCEAGDLAAAIERYFDSDLFRNLNARRHAIREFARARNSWEVVGTSTCDVYARLLSGS